MSFEPPRRRMYPTTEIREYRLRRGVRLQDVAARAGVSLSRASYVERDPSVARKGELEALKAAVDSISAEASNAA